LGWRDRRQPNWAMDYRYRSRTGRWRGAEEASGVEDGWSSLQRVRGPRVAQPEKNLAEVHSKS
jgi:hypothetical protein